MRISYTFNAILTPSIGAVQKMDGEVIKTLPTRMLKSKERRITDKRRKKLIALLGIRPTPLMESSKRHESVFI